LRRPRRNELFEKAIPKSPRYSARSLLDFVAVVVPTTEIKETGARHGEHLYILKAVKPRTISQNCNTTATASSLTGFKPLLWILTLYTLLFFQPSWFPKNFAPRGKHSQRSQIHPPTWNAFFMRRKAIYELPKLRWLANWGSVFARTAGRPN
jgi:hypothetical protein